MYEFMHNPPADLIDITDYLGKDEQVFKSVQELRESGKTVHELYKLVCEDKQYTDKTKLLIGIYWTKLVKD